ncbi:hypothetical protein LZ31DRAFT_160218 [Colletotrichum somersetense]|nr:hypothetical protein LZ31DRAFT_160218 [Colletotrichum somersetense]
MSVMCGVEKRREGRNTDPKSELSPTIQTVSSSHDVQVHTYLHTHIRIHWAFLSLQTGAAYITFRRYLISTTTPRSWSFVVSLSEAPVPLLYLYLYILRPRCHRDAISC